MSEPISTPDPQPADGHVDAHRATLQAAAGQTPPGMEAAGTPEPSSATFVSWIGRTIDDRYRIEALLGEGGMGAVLLAEHLKLQKKVALKVILPQFAGVGELAERFAREAMASGQLDHPHIAPALDYGTLPEGGAYLVMQYVRGRSLREAMKSHVHDWAFACEVGAQIADALSAAHAARIVHRDLKPENVMLEARDGGSDALHVRVLDFGVARVVGDEAAEGPGTRKLTRVGTILGTPGYMAPEQALGETVDERADLYALGVLLWESIVGRELFQGADVPSIVTAQLMEPIEPIGAFVPAVPPELDAMIFRLLAPKRDDRPGKAAEVRDTLRKLALARQLERVSASGSLAASVPRSSGIVTSPALPAAHAPAPAPAAGGTAPTHSARSQLPLESLLPAAMPARRALYFAIAGAAALALVIGGITVGVVFGGSGPPATVAVPVPVPVATGTPPGLPPPPFEPPATHTTAFAPPPTATPPVPLPATATPIGGDLAHDLDILLSSDTRETRRTAAQSLLARPQGSLPPLVDALARLEVGEGCTAKRNALRELRELRDTRALPAVERIDRLPRRGCGMFGMGDCWTCLRRETRSTLRSLRGEAEASREDEVAEPAEPE